MRAKHETNSRQVQHGRATAAALILLSCIALIGGCELPGGLADDIVLDLAPIDVGPPVMCFSVDRLIIPDDVVPVVDSVYSVGNVKALARS